MAAYDPVKNGALCAKCPRRGSVPVPPEGRPGLKVCWLGQDPGKTEVAQLRPFVGATGKRTTHLFEHAHAKYLSRPFVREHHFITNAALCMPLSKSEAEARQAADCCRPRLMKELARLHPKAGILAMGKWAYYAMTGNVTGSGPRQGFHVPAACLGQGERWFMPVIHPASTFRQAAALPVLQAHVENFVTRLVRGFGEAPTLLANPSAIRLRALLADCRRLKRGLAVDVEAASPDPEKPKLALLPGYAVLRSIGVGADIGRGIGMAWDWPPPRGVLLLLKAAFADESLTKVFCNGYYYDIPLLKRYNLEVK